MHIRILYLLVLKLVDFIAYDDQDHIGRAIGLQLLDPGFHDLEGSTAADIVHAQGYFGLPVVYGRDGLVLLLPGCVPELCCNQGYVELDDAAIGEGELFGDEGGA